MSQSTEQTGRTQWWGDCHTHSTWSDGVQDIPSQTPNYTAFGNHYRLQTDHHLIRVPDGAPAPKWLHAADWPRYVDDCRRATTADHLCIPGVELGWIVDADRMARERWFHTKLHPPAGQPLPDESFYADTDYVGLLKRCKAAGQRVIVAHMDQGAPLDLLAGDEIHGLEARLDIEEQRPLFERPNMRHWDRMLSAGHRVSMSAGSDAHHPDLWAGSALRTVVLDTPRENDAILDAVIDGRSYLSGTWHPDGYAALGYPGRPNPVDNGASTTHLIPWWEFKQFDLFAGKERETVVRECFEWSLEHGRVHREDYPVLKIFTVGKAACGGEAPAQARVPVRVAWKTNTPLQVLRLIANGRVLAQPLAGDAAYGRTEGLWETEIDLRQATYVRLELEAWEPATPERRDTLCGNPIYVRS